MYFNAFVLIHNLLIQQVIPHQNVLFVFVKLNQQQQQPIIIQHYYQNFVWMIKPMIILHLVKMIWGLKLYHVNMLYI
eukprot:UN09280